MVWEFWKSMLFKLVGWKIIGWVWMMGWWLKIIILLLLEVLGKRLLRWEKGYFIFWLLRWRWKYWWRLRGFWSIKWILLCLIICLLKWWSKWLKWFGKIIVGLKLKFREILFWKLLEMLWKLELIIFWLVFLLFG